MTPPAAPLEKAVARLHDVIHDWDDGNRIRDPYLVECAKGLLAALDADKRLEEAEAALKEIAAKAGFADECGRFDAAGDFHECDDQKPSEEWCSLCIARRYFARREEKGENRG
jgi:hypothetical protein